MAPKSTSSTGKCSTFTTSKAPAKPADSFKALDKMVKDNKMCHKVYKKMCPLPCMPVVEVGLGAIGMKW